MAYEEAEGTGVQYVGTEHLLKALIREAKSDPSSPVARIVAAWREQHMATPSITVLDS